MEAGHPHVDSLAAKRDPLGLQEAPLRQALSQRSVRAYDAVPGHIGIVATM
jgi:hypothetical protein